MNGGAGKGHEYRRMIKYHTLKGRDAKFLKLAKEKRGWGGKLLGRALISISSK